jgi:hypothetical protein
MKFMRKDLFNRSGMPILAGPASIVYLALTASTSQQ